MHANVESPTMPIGISRSVIGSVSPLPALRARDAAIALARPLATGFTNLSKVQTADTPIAPAPTKRTLRFRVPSPAPALWLRNLSRTLESAALPSPNRLRHPWTLQGPTEEPPNVQMPRGR